MNASELTTDDWLEIPNIYHKTIRWYDKGVPYVVGNTTERERKLAYFYGLFVGDGFTNINKNSYDVYMSIGKDEKELAEFYDSLILDLFGRRCVHVHKDTENTRRFTSKELVQQLDASVGISAYTKRVPEWIKRGSYETKLAFIQGFLDTDGSVFNTKRGVRINFTSVNLELLEDVQDILFAMEIKNSIVMHQKEYINGFGSKSL